MDIVNHTGDRTMGDMADYTIDLAYTSQFTEYMNTNGTDFLESLDIPDLVEMLRTYVNEGYLDETDFPYKMITWYDDNEYLSSKQRLVVINTLSTLPKIDEVDKFYHQKLTPEIIDPTLTDLTNEYQCNESNNYGMTGKFYSVQNEEGYFTMFTLACGSATFKICRHENFAQASEMAEDYNKYSSQM
jgi:hypothetical protein